MERTSLRFEIPFELGHQCNKEEWKNKKECRSFGLQVVSPKLRSTRLDDFNCFIDVLWILLSSLTKNYKMRPDLRRIL